MSLHPLFSLAAIQWDTGLLPLAIPLGALGVLCAAAAYRARKRAMTPTGRLRPAAGHSRWMPVLRAAAWIAVAVSFVKPVAVLISGQQRPPAVLMLVDLSKSMSVRDRQRSAPQCVALADALGRLPAGARQRIAETFFAAISAARHGLDEMALAQREVEFSRFSGRDSQAAERHLRAATDSLAAAAESLAAMRKSFALAGQPLEGTLREIEQWVGHRRDESWPGQLRRLLDRAAGAAHEYQNAEDSRLYYSNAQVKSTCDAIRSMTRIQLALAAASAPSGVLHNLGQSGRAGAEEASSISIYGIGDDISALPVSLFTPGGNSAGLQATDNRSLLVAGARQAVDRATASQRVQAVVLLSDGRDTAGESAGATGLPGTGLPLYAIDVSAPSAARDPAVTHITAPAWAVAGDIVPVDVGVRGRIKEVRLAIGDLPALTATPPAGEGEAEVTFHVMVDRGGLQAMRAEITPVGDDATTENNSATAWIKVSSAKVRIAMIGGPETPTTDPASTQASAESDWALLANDLHRASWIELTGPTPAISPSRILRQNVVIIGDIAASALSDSQRSAIRRLIYQQGGGVLITAGPAHPSPDDAAAWGDWFPLQQSPAAGWPVWRIWPGAMPGFRIQPATGGAGNVSFALNDSLELSMERWSALPALFSYLPLVAGKAGARPLLIEASSGQPVMIERDFGAGKVILLGIDETGRWAARANDSAILQFHQQIIRALAGRPYAVAQPMAAGEMSFDVDPAAPHPNQPLHIRARYKADVRVIQPSSSRPSADRAIPEVATLPALRIEVLQKEAGGVFQRLREEILPAPSLGDRYEATIPGLEAGDYELHVSPAGEADSSETPLKFRLSVAEDDRAEWADVSGDRDFLQRMAEPTGGREIAIDELPELPPLLRQAMRRPPAPVRMPLWDSPYLFGFVAACLIAEWALRKRSGLA